MGLTPVPLVGAFSVIVKTVCGTKPDGDPAPHTMQSVGCGTEIDATQATQLDSNYLNIRTINNSVQQLYYTTLLRI